MIRRSSFYCTSWVRSIGFRGRGREEGEREREGGREGGREGERERGREEERGLIHVPVYWWGVLLFW